MVNLSFSLSLAGLGGTGLALCAPCRAVLLWHRIGIWRGGGESWEGLAVGMRVPWTWEIWKQLFSCTVHVHAHTYTHTHTDPHTDPYTDQKGFSHYSSVSTGWCHVWFSAWELSSSHLVGVTSPIWGVLNYQPSHMKTPRNPLS